MPTGDKTELGNALHRKRRVVALLEDPAATEHERANAKALKERLERLLRKRGTPHGDWTDVAFRLGRSAKKVASLTAPPSPKGDWTDAAFRIGRVLSRAVKRVRPD